MIPIIIGQIWGPTVSNYFRLGNVSETQRRIVRRKRQILLLTGLRLLAWYSFPITLLGTLGVPIESHNVVDNAKALINRLDLWWDSWSYFQGLEALGIFGEVFLDPSGWWEVTLVASVPAALITTYAILGYSFIRAFLWNGVVKEWSFFRP